MGATSKPPPQTNFRVEKFFTGGAFLKGGTWRRCGGRYRKHKFHGGVFLHGSRKFVTRAAAPHFGRQTNRQTNRWTTSVHKAPVLRRRLNTTTQQQYLFAIGGWKPEGHKPIRAGSNNSIDSKKLPRKDVPGFIITMATLGTTPWTEKKSQEPFYFLHSLYNKCYFLFIYEHLLNYWSLTVNFVVVMAHLLTPFYIAANKEYLAEMQFRCVNSAFPQLYCLKFSFKLVNICRSFEENKTALFSVDGVFQDKNRR